MNYKFKKEVFNQKANPKRPSKIHQNYSLEDIRKKMVLYEKLAKRQDDKDQIQKMKSGFEEREARRPGNQMATNIHFEQSKKFGPPVKSWEEVQKQDKEHTQAERNKTMRDLKKYRHQNYSLRKSFRDVNGKTTGKDKVKE